MTCPQALLVCVAAQQAVHFVGLPEANLALAQAVVHLATAPKSNALYEAYSRVQEDVQQTRNDPVPLQIRNAPTQLMKDLDYGKDYKYAHDYYKDIATTSQGTRGKKPASRSGLRSGEARSCKQRFLPKRRTYLKAEPDEK